MKLYSFRFLLTLVLAGFLLLTGGFLFAEQQGPPREVIKSIYQQILAAADKNRDRQLSRAECMSISKNKAKMEKDCKYWDANGDGFITEEEYVKQAKAIMH